MSGDVEQMSVMSVMSDRSVMSGWMSVMSDQVTCCWSVTA